MADVAGKPMLERIIERLRQAGPEVVVATTGEPDDEPIRELARRMKVRYIEGSPTDLMVRHWQVTNACHADVICLAGADDPFLDVTLFDRLVARLSRGDIEYIRSSGWPLGMNAWAWTREAMNEGNFLARARDEREHVVPFWERRPHHYPAAVIAREPDLYDVLRVTVDTASDLELVRTVARYLGPAPSTESVIAFLGDNPDIAAINEDSPHGTEARDAIYDLAPVDDRIEKIRDNLAIERRAALAAVPEQGDFAQGRAAALLSIDQTLG
jgi:spore coat polysaccharide biosynthesis protein SpsF (cytidylyltransferase family)